MWDMTKLLLVPNIRRLEMIINIKSNRDINLYLANVEKMVNS